MHLISKTILILTSLIWGLHGVDLFAKCEAEKQAMDNAWTQYLDASNAWEASLDRLGKALGKKTTAENAYQAASNKVQTLTNEFKQAEADWKECRESSENPDCSVEERMMDRAQDKLDKANDTLMDAFAALSLAQREWEAARDATNALYQKMEQARQDYDEARDAYYRCLRGKKFA